MLVEALALDRSMVLLDLSSNQLSMKRYILSCHPASHVVQFATRTDGVNVGWTVQQPVISAVMQGIIDLHGFSDSITAAPYTACKEQALLRTPPSNAQHQQCLQCASMLFNTLL